MTVAFFFSTLVSANDSQQSIVSKHFIHGNANVSKENFCALENKYEHFLTKAQLNCI